MPGTDVPKPASLQQIVTRAEQARNRAVAAETESIQVRTDVLAERPRVAAEGQYQVDRVDASGEFQVAAIDTAGTTQVAAVNTARAAAIAAIAGQVSAAAGSETAAATSATNAANSAAIANFSGYAASFATKAALGSASGKADGVYLVKADESLSAPATGTPRAYRVASGAYVDSWGVALLTAAAGLDLAGPLTVARPPTNGFTVVRRAPPNAADIAAGFADYTEVTTRSPTGEGGAPDNGWAAGFNAHLVAAEGYSSAMAPFFRTAIEQDWRPGGGQRWYEWYLEMRGPGHTAIRRPLGVTYDKVANRGLAFSVSTDAMVFNDGADVERLSAGNGYWSFADTEQIRMSRVGTLVSGGTPGLNVPLLGFNEDGEAVVGARGVPVRLARATRIGDGTFGGRLDHIGVPDIGEPETLERFYVSDGSEGGVFTEYVAGSEDTFRKAVRTVMRTGPLPVNLQDQYATQFGWRLDYFNGTAYVPRFGIGLNGVTEHFKAGAGEVFTSPNGLIRKMLQLSDEGTFVAVNAPPVPF